MTRRELREQIFKLLFGVEFHDRQELPEQIAVYEETEEPWDTKDGAYISGKCEDIVAHLAEIDEAIDAVADQREIYLSHTSGLPALCPLVDAGI